MKLMGHLADKYYTDLKISIGRAIMNLSQSRSEALCVSSQRAVCLYASPVTVTRHWKQQAGGFLIRGTMREIPLTQGKVALVDDEDYGWFMQWKWCAHYNQKTGEWSVMRQSLRETVYMHRQVMNAPAGMEVDHKDHNRFNNQKSNLRVCTHNQNMFNRKPERGSRSIYKGVSWHKGNGKWQARIVVKGKPIGLGYFDNEIDAAKAFDKAASKHQGEFAYLNFPGEL